MIAEKAEDDGKADIPHGERGGCENKEAVDTFVSQYMQPKGVVAEFDTPRQRSDFGPTYYQVMFVDPEGLAVEVFCG